MSIRTILVDDEPLALERLRGMLEKEPDIEVVEECSDGRQAVETISALQPDLVFLDVQMPELSGLEVVAQLSPESLPAIVFVTAHDQFALKAFDVHAVDYLLKPFDRDRLATALARARQRLKQKESHAWKEQLSALLSDMNLPAAQPGSAPAAAERLAIKADGRVLLIRTADIDWVEAADNYVNIHIGAAEHLHRETMTNMEKLLPANQFIRINRSNIVNVDRIQELHPLFHGEYAVRLKDGTQLTLSRSHRHKLDELLGK